MNIVERWLVAVAASFLFFPVGFVLVKGPDAEAGYLGGMMWMMFIQFLSPFKLWMIPLGVGTVVALAWHLFAKGRADRSS